MVTIEKINTAANGVSITDLCKGAIPGLHPVSITMSAGSRLEFAPACGYYHIFVFVTGRAVFSTDGTDYPVDGKYSFVPAPDKACVLTAIEDSYLLELRFDVQPTDADDLVKYETKFPIHVPYQDSIQYIDPFKSQKTISRMMIPHKIIPRFSMGSVETYGYDLVKPHAHPMLDQLFFSFPENDMEVIIDDVKYNMKGSEILHIPLGSSHGVEVTGDRHLHYMWIDVMPDQAAGLKRLDMNHRPTGTVRDLEKEREEAK